MTEGSVPDRNISMELARATEAAALGAAPWTGRGDKNGADGGAVDAMRAMLNTVDVDGVIVIGEGEKDEAPMLFNGERVGTGIGPKVDVAVDPIDGTTLLSLGRPQRRECHRGWSTRDDVQPPRHLLHGQDRGGPGREGQGRPLGAGELEPRTGGEGRVASLFPR